MSINEFHSKLALRNDESTLFVALRRLRLVDNLKSLAAEEAGWPVWTDATQDPDGGSALYLAAATA